MLFTLLQRVRRNHALEHATINLISQRHPEAQVVGFSGPLGFTLYTSLPAKAVVPVIPQALTRIQQDEPQLRIHANCGTNIVVKAMMTTLATLIGLGHAEKRTWRDHVERLPNMVMLNVLALTLSDPIAFWMQANVTTAADVSRMEIASILSDTQGTYQRIRVHTRHPA